MDHGPAHPETVVGNSISRRYDDIIRQIREVISARVVVNSEGEIEEIHVLAGSGRNPKQIVRDIESAFMAHFGLAVDHKKISIAQVQTEDEPSPAGGARVRLKRVAFQTAGRTAEARVEVEFDDVTVEGSASGLITSSRQLRLPGEATLRAIEHYFKGDGLFSLEEVANVAFGNRSVMVVIVAFVGPAGEELFSGSSLVRGDERLAVARATLDAINRRLAVLVRKTS